MTPSPKLTAWMAAFGYHIGPGLNNFYDKTGNNPVSYAGAEILYQAKLDAERAANDEGFKEGQRVGQYQAADKLYSHIAAIYMFRDGDKKATAIAESNATELLKDCEKYLNHNSKVYTDYVRGDRYKRMHPKEFKKKEPNEPKE